MTLYMVEGTLTPVAPFDFAQTLRFLGIFKPAMGEQQIEDLSLTKGTSFNGQVVVFRVASVGSIEQPLLTYTLFSDMPILQDVCLTAEARIRFFLSLDDDLRPLYAVGENDPAFEPVMRQLYGYHQVKFLTPFENACWAIISQRNLMTVSKRMKQALTEQFGSQLEVEGIVYEVFPEPFALAMRSADEINVAVRNLWKSQGLSAVAHAFDNVDEQWLRTAPTEEVERWLRSIKGIGAWSASFILLRGLGRMSTIPVDDKWLIEAAALVYGQMATPEDVKRLSAHYGDQAGYWAHYLRAST